MGLIREARDTTSSIFDVAIIRRVFCESERARRAYLIVEYQHIGLRAMAINGVDNGILSIVDRGL